MSRIFLLFILLLSVIHAHTQSFYGIDETSNTIGSSQTCASPVISSFPYAENFDALAPNNSNLFSCITTDNMTDCWVNESQSSNFWAPRSSATSSSNTGPANDNTSGTGNYVFLETSACNGSFKLVSPIFDVSSISHPYFEFYYHMFGTQMGILGIQTSTNGTTWQTQWSKNGDQGDLWIKGELDLSAFTTSTTLQLRFVGTITGSLSDLAIDDVSLYNNPGSNTESIQQLSKFNVYPNPSSGSVAIDLEFNQKTDLNIQVVSLVGKTLLNEQVGVVAGALSLNYDLSHLPAGIYFIQLNSEKQTSIKKLVINK